MQFTEFGKQNGKTLLLLPGTVCTWQLNFKNVIDELAEKYHIIAVNYDGFEGDPNRVFTDIPTVTAKIEDYILENHNGSVNGVYGSSLGGSIAGLLTERKRIHIDHVFIGSSDLDQGSKWTAGLLGMLISVKFGKACTSETKRMALKEKLQKKAAGETKETREFAKAFIDSLQYLNPKTVSRQFVSDYVTPLADNIHADGTAVHVIYALQMGEKYGRRYRRHFQNADIHEFDMKHEARLFDDAWRKPVLEMIDSCMGSD